MSACVSSLTRVSEDELSYQDTERLLLRLGDESERLVVVGGQAVNFWAHWYSKRISADLNPYAPYTSYDVDVCASRKDVQKIARRLQGKPRVAGFDDYTPNAGTVVYRDEKGVKHTLDVMAMLAGLDTEKDVKGPAVTIQYEVGGRLLKFRVMHPVIMMESRVHNIMLLPQYRTEHGFKQAHASIVCAREFLKDPLDEGGPAAVADVLSANERIFRFRTESRDGSGIAVAYGIDVFDAILVDDRLGEEFVKKRYPQMLEVVDAMKSKAGSGATR